MAMTLVKVYDVVGPLTRSKVNTHQRYNSSFNFDSVERHEAIIVIKD